jgi:hypothetical protein
MTDNKRQLLTGFRKFARSHIGDFDAARDRLAHLLGARQPYPIGSSREELVRTFLRGLLPRGVTVSTGVIYGFEVVPNSAQIDVLVWDSTHHPAVYAVGDFTVVPPEAVIAAISVKSGAAKQDFDGTVENLDTVALLDEAFRSETASMPIIKMGVFFSSPNNPARAAGHIADAIGKALTRHEARWERVRGMLTAMDPALPSELTWPVERHMPRLFVCLGESQLSYFRGYGPPGRTVDEARCDAIPRLPFLYPQRSELTSPLEKLGFYVLRNTMSVMGVTGWSVVSAWADADPVTHVRAGDIEELTEDLGVNVLRKFMNRF